MKPRVKEALEQFYCQADRGAYLARCRDPLPLPGGVEAALRQSNIAVREYHPGRTWPARRFTIRLRDVVRGEFSAVFSTTVQVSKLSDLYAVEHTFKVVNRDDEGLEPTLHGSSSMAFTRVQVDLEGALDAGFGADGYEKLSLAEMGEVIPWLTFPAGVKVFGPQVTVEYSLFHDLLALCSSTS